MRDRLPLPLRDDSYFFREESPGGAYAPTEGPFFKDRLGRRGGPPGPVPSRGLPLGQRPAPEPSPRPSAAHPRQPPAPVGRPASGGRPPVAPTPAGPVPTGPPAQGRGTAARPARVVGEEGGDATSEIGETGNFWTRFGSMTRTVLRYDLPVVLRNTLMGGTIVALVAFLWEYKSESLHWEQHFPVINWTLLALTFLVAVLGLIAALAEMRHRLWRELVPFAVFVPGAVLIVLPPILQGVGLGADEMYAGYERVMVAFGALIAGAGVVWTARKGGFFLIWLFGVGAFLVVSSHEAFRVVAWTGSYGPVDLALALSSLLFIATGTLLYLYTVAVDVIITHGSRLRQSGHLDDALRFHDLAIRLNPFSEVAWNNRGNTLASMRRLDEAAECYERAIELNPQYSLARLNQRIAVGQAGPPAAPSLSQR